MMEILLQIKTKNNKHKIEKVISDSAVYNSIIPLEIIAKHLVDMTTSMVEKLREDLE